MFYILLSLCTGNEGKIAWRDWAYDAGHVADGYVCILPRLYNPYLQIPVSLLYPERE